MSQLAQYPKLEEIIQRIIADDPLTLVRCISRAELIDLLAELGEKTLDRLEQCGQGPPKTQLSDRRVGYRLVHVAAWLDARRHPGTLEQIGLPAQRVVESIKSQCGADIRDHSIKMQRELNRRREGGDR
jgi:predicted DNA-binding transcriptional regulator AlpA